MIKFAFFGSMVIYIIFILTIGYVSIILKNPWCLLALALLPHIHYDDDKDKDKETP